MGFGTWGLGASETWPKRRDLRAAAVVRRKVSGSSCRYGFCFSLGALVTYTVIWDPESAPKHKRIWLGYPKIPVTLNPKPKLASLGKPIRLGSPTRRLMLLRFGNAGHCEVRSYGWIGHPDCIPYTAPCLVRGAL